MAIVNCIGLIILYVIASFHNHAGHAEAQDIGVNFGTIGSDLPPPSDVVNLYKKYNIAKMRLFNPNPTILGALKGSGIGVTVGVVNGDLTGMAAGGQPAVQVWYDYYIAPFVNDVKFDYIAVGNEVDTTGDLFKALVVLPLLNNIVSAKGIKVTTVVSTSIVASSYPPSSGAFTADTNSTMFSILAFLASINSPIMVNVYPYFAYKSDPGNVRLDYAQFTAPGVVVQDGSYGYVNLFDAIVDAFISAMEKAGQGNTGVVVSETGWPSAGSGNLTTPELAATYNKNLLNHIVQKAGTPKRPGAMEAFIFAIFNENEKPAGEEQNWGLFYPNMQPVYNVFS